MGLPFTVSKMRLCRPMSVESYMTLCSITLGLLSKYRTTGIGPTNRYQTAYVPRTGSALCSPVPMFPGTDVPRTYVPRYLCSPVPMFAGFLL